MDVEHPPDEAAQHHPGLDRRALIKRAAAAGAVAWVAPVVIDSLASPAAALTPIAATGCYYIVLKSGKDAKQSKDATWPLTLKDSGFTLPTGAQGSCPNACSVYKVLDGKGNPTDIDFATLTTTFGLTVTTGNAGTTGCASQAGYTCNTTDALGKECSVKFSLNGGGVFAVRGLGVIKYKLSGKGEVDHFWEVDAAESAGSTTQTFCLPSQATLDPTSKGFATTPQWADDGTSKGSFHLAIKIGCT